MGATTSNVLNNARDHLGLGSPPTHEREIVTGLERSDVLYTVGVRSLPELSAGEMVGGESIAREEWRGIIQCTGR